MADHTRRDMRTPITLKIKFKSSNLDQFIERYSVDVSRGGIFIRTKEPLAVGTQLKFEFQLQDACSLIAGEGTVVWIREHDPARSRRRTRHGRALRQARRATAAGAGPHPEREAKRGDAQLESRFDAGVRATAPALGHAVVVAAARGRATMTFRGGDSRSMTPLAGRRRRA